MNTSGINKDDTQIDEFIICGKTADYTFEETHFSMLVCSTVILGGFLRARTKNSEVLVLTFLSISGFMLGQLAHSFVEIHKIIYPLLKTSSVSLYCYFLPIIIFEAALDMDFYIIRNVLWQVLLTGAISFSLSLTIIGFVTMKFNKEMWDLQSCVLFSFILSIIDPLHSVNSLKTIGASKMIIDFIRGESLAICSITSIIMALFWTTVVPIEIFKEINALLTFLLDISGSILLGYVCARIIQFIFLALFSNTSTNVVLCFSTVYLSFTIAELIGLSGFLVVATVGLNLDSLSFKPRNELVITEFLIMFSSVCQRLIYTFFGIVIGCGETKYFKTHSLVFIFILFFSLNVIRLLTIMLVSPIFKNSNYEYNWKWGVATTWSGVKGVFSLILAPEVYNLAETKIRSPHMLNIGKLAVSVYTLYTSDIIIDYGNKFIHGDSVCQDFRQMARRNVIWHIQEIIQNTIPLFRTEKNLMNVDWTLVETKTWIERSIPFDAVKSSYNENKTSPTDEDLIEEARLPVAIIQMSSFEEQCNDGILSLPAARILIGATKSYCPIRGKFMTIHDVSSYVKARSWLMKFRSILTFLEYRKEKPQFATYANNTFLFIVYQIVFSEEFEYAEYITALMYAFPMMVHLWPMAREFNVSALIFVNYYFILLYILQAVLKIIIFKNKYFQQCWHNLEFFILLVGVADAFSVYSVRLRPDNLTLIQVTVIMGYFRMLRFLPIIKVIIPVLISIVDVLIKKGLSLMYIITKGYVRSQEEAKLLIKQICGQESIYEKLYDILEANRRDAVRELGLIEHEGRDVVISLKSKQAIWNMIVKARKSLTFLWSKGIIDDHEGIEINKVLLKNIKELDKIPVTIPPPTLDKYLHDIIWLENKKVLIEFFKERAKLAYFDYRDTICKEGEMPRGIYLIISGMAILHSSPPSFGIDSTLRPGRHSKTMFTEFCTSGDIIGELNCLIKREIEYTAVCETILQACFISVEDLYEGFDVFWPSLEYKIWLKLALQTASRYFDSSLAGEDLTFQKCMDYSHAYVETLSSSSEMIINEATMKFVIIVYGSVIDMKTEKYYYAPSMIPTTCERLQGTSNLSKLLIFQASEPASNIGHRHEKAKREHNWKN